MELKSIVIGIVATLLFLSTVAVGGFVATGGLGESTESSNDSPQQANTPTAAPVDESEVPKAVEDSLPGAKALKMNLTESEKFSDARVNINQQGEVIVSYSSEASNGPELKKEMGRIATRYAAVVGDNPDTGGLTVVANGVKLMVSSDAAAAYDDGKLKDDAYKQTFHWSSVSQGETDSGE